MDVTLARGHLEELRTRAKMIEWVNGLEGFQVQGKLPRDIAKEIGDYLNRNDRTGASAAALAYALVNGEGAVDALRRAGVLRSSRYQFKAGAPKGLVMTLLSLSGALKLPPRTVQYLNSLIALYDISVEARKIRHGLVKRMESRRGRALKTYLAVANQAFANDWPYDKQNPSSDLHHYSAEEISDAVSRLIMLHREALGLSACDWIIADKHAASEFNGTLNCDLLGALHLNEFMRSETLIDGLPYKATLHRNAVIVESIDPDLERSVRLGYVQADLQAQYRHRRMERQWNDGQAPLSLETVCQELFENGLDKFTLYKPKPIPRLVPHIPPAPEFLEFIAKDCYFKEDVQSLLSLGLHEYDGTTLAPFQVVDGITSIDLFKVNRIFGFVARIMSLALERIENAEERKLITLNSVVPFLPKKEILRLLQMVLDPIKSQAAFDLLRFDDSREFADLQYMPFVCVDDRVLLAPALVARSNLVRNITVANRRQEDRIKDRDPMQNAVAAALRDAGFLVGVDIGTEGGTEHDIDIIAYLDGVLYAFECKNAYHPCNAHEMRNSYDHIEKAGRQLTRRKDWLSHPANQIRMFAKAGWSGAPTASIRTGVLIANRVFTGALIDNHPVRQAHEFINMVSRGFIRADDGTRRSLWQGDTVTTDDIDRYLGDTGLLSDHFASMSHFNFDYALGGKILRFKSWMFDIKRHHEIISAKYRLMPQAPDSVTDPYW